MILVRLLLVVLLLPSVSPSACCAAEGLGTAPVVSVAARTASEDPVAAALAAVRDNKRDMYARESSVLGLLDSPAQLAALQMACRPIPALVPGHAATLTLDAVATRHVVSVAADFAARLTTDKSRGRAVIPLGPTGAQIRDLIGSPCFAVMHVLPGTPADHHLQENDILVGANGRLFTDAEDPRPELGMALSDCQGSELQGSLQLHLVRGHVLMTVPVVLPHPRQYSATWPDACATTAAIATETIGCVITEHGTPFDFWTPLFLLASGDEVALERARRYVYDYVRPAASRDGLPAGNSWVTCYHLLSLCEYYQLTGDAVVLPEIQFSVRILERQQFASGGWSHGEPGGYGEINNVGIVCLMSLVLARDCGVPVSPEVLAKGIRYFGKWCGTNLPYGMGSPGGRAGRMDNGMNGEAAITFALLGETEMATRWARSACYMWMGRERGHAESIFNMAWGPLGASLAPPEEYHMFMQKMLWYYELARTVDHGFVYMSNTHWAYAPDMTAAVGLGYFLPGKRLRIMGAPKGVFSSPAPAGMDAALACYRAKDFAAAKAAAQHALSTAPAAARELLAACAAVERTTSATLALARTNIHSGQKATATRQLEALNRFLGTPQAEAVALLATLTGTITDATSGPRHATGAFIADWDKGLPSSEQFAYSPESIARFNRQALAGLPLDEVARSLGHFNGGPAEGAVLEMAARGPAAVPLLQRLLSDTHPYVRAGAIAALAQMVAPQDHGGTPMPRTQRAVDAALTMIRPVVTDPHPEVQRALATYVNSLQTETAETRQLVVRIAAHDDPSVRIQALAMCTHWVTDPATCVEAARLVIAAPLGGTPGDWDTANTVVARYRDSPVCRAAIPAMAAFLRNQADTKPFRGFFSDGAHFRAMEIMQAQWDARIEAIPDLVPGLCRSYVRVPAIAYPGWVHTRALAKDLLNRCTRVSVPAIRQTIGEEQAWIAQVDDVKLLETTQGDRGTARTVVAGFIHDLTALADRLDQ